MPRERAQTGLVVERCGKCHNSTLFRVAHCLRREDQGKTDTEAHLKQQFPEMEANDWAWVKHELGNLRSIREMYSDKAREYHEPVWIVWLRAHNAVRRVEGGWMIGKPRGQEPTRRTCVICNEPFWKIGAGDICGFCSNDTIGRKLDLTNKKEDRLHRVGPLVDNELKKARDKSND